MDAIAEVHHGARGRCTGMFKCCGRQEAGSDGALVMRLQGGIPGQVDA